VADDRGLDCRGSCGSSGGRLTARRRADHGGQPDQQPAVRSGRGRVGRGISTDRGGSSHRHSRRALAAVHGRCAAVPRTRARDRFGCAPGRCGERPYLPRRTRPIPCDEGQACDDRAVLGGVGRRDRRHRRFSRARRREPGVRRLGHRPKDSRPRLQRALAERPARGRAAVRPAGRIDRPATRVRSGCRRARAASDHAPVDRGRTRPGRGARARVQPLGLRDQHADWDGVGAGDRLRAVRRLAVPRGTRPGS
jgi:hypothetical protein